MKEIALTQGKTVLVDDQDYECLNQWKWCARQGRHTFYARRNIRVTKGKQKQTPLYMHRVILGLQPDDKRQCDHIDGNGLNNQRTNLRICTHIQNLQSQRSWKIGTSRYKGVWWYRRDRTWQSQIQVNKKRVHLGYFVSEIEAAHVYNEAARQYFGEFARLNELR